MRYAFISITKYQSARDIIKLIDFVAKQHQIIIVLADQYMGSNSKEVKDYMQTMKTILIFTSVECLESNRLNEKLYQTLVNRVRYKINSGEKKQSKIAEKCVDEYNSITISVTKCTLSYLLFGVKPVILPVELQEKNI